MTRPAHTDAVRRAAALARLALAPGEAEQLASQFERILGAFDRLSEVDENGIRPDEKSDEQPEEALGNSFASPNAPLRPDTPLPSLGVESALENALHTVDGFYSVPKTIRDDS